MASWGRTAWGLAVLLALAWWLRWLAAGQSLWLDELHTSWVVAGEWSQIVRRAQQGNSTPGYFYLVWAVVQTFGPSEVTLRAVSLVAGTLLVPALFGLVWAWGGQVRGAFLAAVIAALDRDNLFFATEARPYALLQLCAVWQVYWFWEAVRDEANRRAPWYAALGCALLLGLHVTTLWLPLAQLAFLLVHDAWRRHVRSIAFWSALLLPATALLLQISFLQEVFARRANWEQFIALPSWRSATQLFPWTWYLLVPTVGLLLDGGWQAWHGGTADRVDRDRKHSWGPLFAWTLCWLLLPVVGAALSAQFDGARLFFRRYLLVAGLALPVWAGLCVACQRTRWVRWGTILILLVGYHGPSCLLLAQTGYWPLPVRPQDWRGAVERIATDARKGDQRGQGETATHTKLTVLLLDNGLIETPWVAQLSPPEREQWRGYLLYPLAGIYDPRIPSTQQVPLVAGAAQPIVEADDVRKVRDANVVWLLSASREPQLQQRLLAQLSAEGHTWQVLPVERFGQLRLIGFTRVVPSIGVPVSL